MKSLASRDKPLKEKKSNQIRCLNCREYKASNSLNFYSNSSPLFSTEKIEVCKKCLLGFIGSKEQAGYLNRVRLVLALMDKPFVWSLWIQRSQDWSKYIPQLSTLSQYKDLTFIDSDFEEKSNVSYIDGSIPNIDETIAEIDYVGDIRPQENKKIYSSKWMGEYTYADIEYLENYYLGLDRDFKIVTTNHKDYAKKIAKASLHMDKCFQDMLAGVSGADKKYKDAKDVFDTLSKSAQFSESQRGQNDVSLGGFGVTFDMVEQNQWIPKHTELNEDDYDKLIKQFSTIRESV